MDREVSASPGGRGGVQGNKGHQLPSGETTEDRIRKAKPGETSLLWRGRIVVRRRGIRGPTAAGVLRRGRSAELFLGYTIKGQGVLPEMIATVGKSFKRRIWISVLEYWV